MGREKAAGLGGDSDHSFDGSLTLQDKRTEVAKTLKDGKEILEL
jgi:hypothetical protein